VSKGLVEKAVNRHDKRLVDVTITLSGRDLLKMMDNHSAEIDNIFQNLTEPEVNQLNFLLDKTREQKG
jgi:DNA-binding MarR family transcriptional regulator